MPAKRRGEIPGDGPSMPIAVSSCRQVSARSRQFASTCMLTGYTLGDTVARITQGKPNKARMVSSRSSPKPELGVFSTHAV